MPKQKRIKFRDSRGELVGRQNGMRFCIRMGIVAPEEAHTPYWVQVIPGNEETVLSTVGHQLFSLGGAKEFCHRVAAGEISLEDLRRRYAEEDAANERAAIRSATERAMRLQARLDTLGLRYTDLLELEAMMRSMGDISHNILLGYERGRGGRVGPENSDGPFAVHIDGQLVEIGRPMPERSAADGAV